MNDMNATTFGELLTVLRKQQRMSQQDLAAKLDVHRNTVSKWERGMCLPESKTMVLELARQLRLDTHDSRRLLEASLTAISPYWHVPYQRNPFFTGRDGVLDQLYNALNQEHAAILSQSYALSGLGGIGKTQTAIEYAYRYASDYAAIFWIGADTYESAVSSFLAIANVLNLPEKQEQEQSRVIAAVTHWLNSHSEWLLILDNVEDLELVKSILPSARCGSLLFTSRRQALGLTAQTLDLEQMTLEEGMRFLLHRARLLDPTLTVDQLSPADKALATEIVVAMDGLPLALDQAGAYIEATQCSLSDYLSLLQSSHLRLLDERNAHADHPLSVVRTFTLAFEQLERSNSVAAELLTVCAFLAPDAIPETLFTEGAAHLGPTLKVLADPFQFQAAIKALLTYSLVQRNAATQTVTIHRLVQAVLKGHLSEAALCLWTRRILHAITQLFPLDQETQVNYWQDCERLLPHALVCIAIYDQWKENMHDYIMLATHVAPYLLSRALYGEAESLLQNALHIGVHVLKPEHPLIANVLLALAHLSVKQGNYAKAESLFQQALRIRMHMLGSEHSLVAEILSPLADLLLQRGNYVEAEPLLQQALRIRMHTLGPEHPLVVGPLSVLGILYALQDNYVEAEPLLQQALRIRMHTLGSEHPLVANALNNLAELYRNQGKYEQAEPLFQQTLHIWEQSLGTGHPNVAMLLTNLADLYIHQGRYMDAESLYLRALGIREQVLGGEHPYVAYCLDGLATLYTEQGKYDQAKPLYQRALVICQQTLDPQHPTIAETLHHLAHFHSLQQQTAEALPLYQQALTIREQKFGSHHPKTIETRIAYIQLLREVGRVEEAETIEAQVPEQGKSIGEVITFN